MTASKSPLQATDITPTRLEAFSDGVIAIIITIMVLELKVPHDTTPRGLVGAWPVFLSYAISYVMVAIYWMNHHHLFRLVHKVNTRTLWSNMLLLFTVSLIPFTTAYMGETHIAKFPTMVYAVVLLFCAAAHLVLISAVFKHIEKTEDSECLRKAMVMKNVVAIALYAASVPLALYWPKIALMMAVVVGGMYVLPNTWIEKRS